MKCLNSYTVLQESSPISWSWHIRGTFFAIPDLLVLKCLKIYLIQFSHEIYEININFHFPDEEQRGVSMIKELDRVHTGIKSRTENSDPSRSVSKVQAFATVSPGLHTTPLWVFAGTLLPHSLQTSCTM